MGVVKLTSSKKAVQFITDEGVVYQASADFLARLLGGEWRGDFMKLTRFANGVSPDRFPKSPVYGEVVATYGELTTNNDSLSVKARERAVAEKPIVDNKVEW